MRKGTTENIVCCLWAFFLFGLWLMLSFNKGTEGEWWSVFVLIPEKAGPMALEFSYLKIFLFASLSVVVAYLINRFLGKKKT